MVKDTNADINTAAASVTPNSRNNLPTNPSKKITGKNTIASVIEVDITAKNISLLPSNAAFRIGNPAFQFSENIFRYHNTIIHHQTCCQYDAKQG